MYVGKTRGQPFGNYADSPCALQPAALQSVARQHNGRLSGEHPNGTVLYRQKYVNGGGRRKILFENYAEHSAALQSVVRQHNGRLNEEHPNATVLYRQKYVNGGGKGKILFGDYTENF